MNNTADFVAWFRSVAPYIHTFRENTFVIGFSGDTVIDEKFMSFIHDINLLASLGVRLVLVHGARSQIVQRLHENQLQLKSAMGIDIIDNKALLCVIETTCRVQQEIVALLSMGLPSSPMANATIRVASGNFLTAKPLGILNGIDYQHTGTIRKINIDAIQALLKQNNVVLISPLGYSLTGEVFSLTMENVATEIASALQVDKLIFLLDSLSEDDTSHNSKYSLPRELTIEQCESLLHHDVKSENLSDEIRASLSNAVKACENGVSRTHLISRHTDGAILKELFTHYGIGSMVSQKTLESFRSARTDDVGSILQLIDPLEAEGILVKRNRELLETEIDRFIVFEHDGTITGCAALHPFPQEQACELACFAIHPAYRNQGYGRRLLKKIEEMTVSQGNNKLFVLTTHATHWFIEQAFIEASITDLPKLKQVIYNDTRQSKVFIKTLRS